MSAASWGWGYAATWMTLTCGAAREWPFMVLLPLLLAHQGLTVLIPTTKPQPVFLGSPVLSVYSRQHYTDSLYLHQVQPVCSLIRVDGRGPGTLPASNYHTHAVITALHRGHCGEQRMGVLGRIDQASPVMGIYLVPPEPRSLLGFLHLASV